MQDIVIVSAARTAVGKFGGSLAKVAAPYKDSFYISHVRDESSYDVGVVAARGDEEHGNEEAVRHAVQLMLQRVIALENDVGKFLF